MKQKLKERPKWSCEITIFEKAAVLNENNKIPTFIWHLFKSVFTNTYVVKNIETDDMDDGKKVEFNQKLSVINFKFARENLLKGTF